MRKTSRAFYGCPRYAPASHSPTLPSTYTIEKQSIVKLRQPTKRGTRHETRRGACCCCLMTVDCSLMKAKGLPATSDDFWRACAVVIHYADYLQQRGEGECNGAGVAEAATRITIVKGTALHADKHSCTCGKQNRKKIELAKVATQKLSVTVRLPPSTHGTIANRNSVCLSLCLCEYFECTAGSRMLVFLPVCLSVSQWRFVCIKIPFYYLCLWQVIQVAR